MTFCFILRADGLLFRYHTPHRTIAVNEGQTERRNGAKVRPEFRYSNESVTVKTLPSNSYTSSGIAYSIRRMAMALPQRSLIARLPRCSRDAKLRFLELPQAEYKDT